MFGAICLKKINSIRYTRLHPGLFSFQMKSYGCERITIQSGGTVNGLFLREKLFDYIDVVMAPVLIGGKETASLIDGDAILTENELSGLGVLKLIDCTVLSDSYIRVRYQVIS